MIRKDILVKIPEKTKIQTYGNVKYVYYVKSREYINRTRGYKENRVSIGKAVDDHTMKPNDNYFSLFNTEDVDEKVPTYSDALHVGSTLLLSKIANKLGLTKILYDIHNDKHGLILDLANYMIVEQSNVMQHYPKFQWEHYTNYSKMVSDSQITEFSKEINIKEIERFLRDWNKIQSKKTAVYISYDSTNFTTNSDGIDLAEIGHSKDGSDLPQINLSYAVKHNEALPLFYELYPGSLIDNNQCRYMLDKAREYGYEKVGFILDRGYFSLGNIKYIEENGCNYVLMMKIGSSLIRDELEQAKEEIPNRVVYHIGKHKVYGKTYTKQLFGESTQYIHIYYDDDRAHEERDIRMSQVEKNEILMQKYFIEQANVTEGIKNEYKDFEIKIQDGKVVEFKRRFNRIQEDIDSFGYFALITSEKMSAEEALNIYRERDSIEKIFAMLKTGCGCEKERVHSQQGLEFKVYISFIASIIRSYLQKTVHKLYLEDKKNYIVPAIMDELEKIMYIKNANDEYVRRYGLTKRQKSVLNLFGIDEKAMNKNLEYVNSRK